MAHAAVWVLFFLSGACGLVYEVLWSRQLGLVFGHTVQSLAAVLSAFMAGLALGSFLAGRYLAPRRRLLLIYGLLEVFIGLYCAALPWLFQAIVPLYRHWYGETGAAGLPAARFAISFLLLLIPTTCMGATLPVLAQFMVRAPLQFARTAGTLYAVNTFGAVFGAAATGFFLVPAVGQAATNWLAVACNLGLGLAAVALNRRAEAQRGAPALHGSGGCPARRSPDGPAGGGARGSLFPAWPERARAARVAAAAFGVTGFAAMATQIGWTRGLSLSLGSSTYSFSLIVAVFILGLALGGAWGARASTRLSDPVGALARVLLGIGLLALLVTAALGWGPLVFFWLIAVGSQWGFATLLLIEAFGVALILIVPTFLMGATLPFTLRIAQDAECDGGTRQEDGGETAEARAGSLTAEGGAGRMIGTLYALNTAGSILGSLLGGLVLLPALQIQNTLKATALLYTVPGVALFLLSPSRRGGKERLVAGVLAAGAVGLLFLPAWDPLQMNLGAYLLRQSEPLRAAREGRWSEAIPRPLGDKVLFYREGATATVAVLEHADGLSLVIGGKPDASSSDDMSTQVGLTLMPELLHEAGPREVLVIGMGSGVSLGAALAPPTVQRVDLVEISPEVIEASACFARFSGLRYEERGGRTWLAEPKIEVILNDGRNHLALTSRRYDVIASEPSNPWIAGIGNLFTAEAFAACHGALRPGGLMCQWLHRYGMGEREFKSVLATFAREFPHAQLWCVLPGSDYLLIGSDQPLRVDLARLKARLAEPRASVYLRKVCFDQPEDFLACFMADADRVREITRDVRELHTDDNLRLEFAAPKTLLPGAAHFEIAPWRVSPERILEMDGLEPAARHEFLRRLDLAVAGRHGFDQLRDLLGLAEEGCAAAMALCPRQPWALVEGLRLNLHRRPGGKEPPAEDDPEGEVERLEREAASAAKDEPALPRRLARAYARRALARIEKGQWEEAARDLEQAEARTPDLAEAALGRMKCARARGDLDAVLKAAAKANAAGVPPDEVAFEIARTFQAAGKADAALGTLAKLLDTPSGRRRPEAAPLWALRAEVLARAGDVEGLRGAAEALQVRAALEPLSAGSYLDLCQAQLRLGEALVRVRLEPEALEAWRQARRNAHAACVFADKSASARVLLARAWLALGEREAARAATDEARRLGGEGFTLPRELETLRAPE
jgi:spermidine synthase